MRKASRWPRVGRRRSGGHARPMRDDRRRCTVCRWAAIATRRPQGLLPVGDGRHLFGVLSGANWGPFAAVARARESHAKGRQRDRPLLWRPQIAGFIDPDEFKRQIDDWIRTFRATKPAPGTTGPLIPGDPEATAEAVRTQQVSRSLPPSLTTSRHCRQTGIPFN